RTRPRQATGARPGPVLGPAAPAAGQGGVRRRPRAGAAPPDEPGRGVPAVARPGPRRTAGTPAGRTASHHGDPPLIAPRGDRAEGTVSGDTDRNRPGLLGRSERLHPPAGGGTALPVHRRAVAGPGLAVAGEPLGAGHPRRAAR